MDKAGLKALILSKGQALGLDPSLIESMLVSKPSLQTQTDQAQLQGTQLGNLQKTLNIGQDQELAPLNKKAKEQQIEINNQSLNKARQDAEDKKKSLNAAADAIQRGEMTVRDLGPSKNLVFDILHGRGFKVKPQQTVAQQQQDEIAKNTLADIDLFEKNFEQAGLRGGASPLTKVFGLLPSNTGYSPESADFDAQAGVMAYGLASAIAQQRGQGVSDKDITFWKNVLPSRFDTDQEAKNKMDNVRKQLAIRMGTKPTQTTIGSKTVAAPQGASGYIIEKVE